MKTAPLLFAVLILQSGCGPEGQPASLLRGSTATVVAGSESTTTNAPDCPATWAGARDLCSAETICPVLGKSCSYPNAGDWESDGTWATAGLFCTDLHAAQLGLDAGTGVWTCAQ